MRYLVATTAVLITAPLAASPCSPAWADAKIVVPPMVQSFIANECQAAIGSSEETVDECIRAEGYGYRAQVTLLASAEHGERAQDRYRICTGGMGCT